MIPTSSSSPPREAIRDTRRGTTTLLANPDTEVQIGRARRPVHARVATAGERDRLWPKAVATYAGYEGYQQRTEREIPLVILEPR
jgi:deazaflavin-dependent oxidoreductase (nitroreductase family)